ncbi:MAG: AMP-binding protein [Pyrinomonadaceae bacterium]
MKERPNFPLAQTVKEGFDQVETCENMIVMTIDPTAPSPIEGAQTLTEITKNKSENFETFPTAPHDTCAILYTSGTTGQPKGAELTHLNLMTNVTTTYGIHLPVLDFTDGVQKTCLITLPLFHTTGQTVQMNVNLYAGNRVVLLPRFDPQATLEAMEKERVNFWVGVPTMYWALVEIRRGK